MNVYCDTSFLASLYIRDERSEFVARWARSSPAPLPLTGLIEVEINNAIQLRLFRKEITSGQAGGINRLMEQDLARGFFRRVPMDPDLFSRAVELARIHTPVIGCRTLDILHVAAALALDSDGFYSFDERQRELARRAGLNIKP